MIASQQRILSLDVIRGFAVLGILVINVQAFSQIEAARSNPMATGDLSILNLIIWAVSHLLFDSKFIALFTMLFGAGVLLFLQRHAGQGAEPAEHTAKRLHFRRMGFLLMFGLIHAYLIWWGDVLVSYALCGFFIYLCRGKSIRWLSLVGLSFYSIIFILILLAHWIAASDPEFYLEFNSLWQPSFEEIEQEINAVTGNFWQQLHYRAMESFSMQTEDFLGFSFWYASGLMLIGMALFKTGLFQQRFNSRDLIRISLLSLLIGTSLTAYGIYYNFQNFWAIQYSLLGGFLFNYVGSLFMALGYLLAIVAIVQLKIWQPFCQQLALVGRAAFSNYIFQSLMGMLVFTGTGFGLFGSVDRVGQILFVICVWAVQISLTILWFRYYSQGPLEWLWRRLTFKIGYRLTRRNVT